MQLITTDHQLANSILDTLGYTLQDISLAYGDVVIPQGDISHQLYKGNSLLGHVWAWGGCYHVSPDCIDRTTPELAALDLITHAEIRYATKKIEANRALVPDYF